MVLKKRERRNLPKGNYNYSNMLQELMKIETGKKETEAQNNGESEKQRMETKGQKGRERGTESERPRS